jgi:hypothetical protein
MKRAILVLVCATGTAYTLSAQPPSGPNRYGPFPATLTLQNVVIPAPGVGAGDKITTSVTQKGNSFTVTINYQTPDGKSTTTTYTVSAPSTTYSATYIPAGTPYLSSPDLLFQGSLAISGVPGAAEIDATIEALPFFSPCHEQAGTGPSVSFTCDQSALSFGSIASGTTAGQVVMGTRLLLYQGSHGANIFVAANYSYLPSTGDLQDSFTDDTPVPASCSIPGSTRGPAPRATAETKVLTGIAGSTTPMQGTYTLKCVNPAGGACSLPYTITPDSGNQSWFSLGARLESEGR